MKRIGLWIVQGLLWFPLPLYASFIEATMGAAVVNDATAVLYNPGALLQLTHPQLIGLVSMASFQSQFTGTVFQPNTGYRESGRSTSQTRYYLPSLYFAIPVSDKVISGVAVVTNFFHRDANENNILRYVQSGNAIQDIDFIPAIGIAVTPSFSIGAHLNISYAHFNLRPIMGVPGFNIPDNQSRNDCHDTSWGGDVGMFYKLRPGTLMGFNYRSAVTYHMRGESVLVNNPAIISRDYHFTYWTPARSVFSLSQRLTQKLGVIGTLQYIQWNIFKEIHNHNFVALVNGQPMIVANSTAPIHFHNGWLVTLGTIYHAMPSWILRLAGSWVESPASGRYQVAPGDSFTLAFSTGYTLNRYVVLDLGYAHSFIQKGEINILSARNRINGVNEAARNALSLKLTLNF